MKEEDPRAGSASSGLGGLGSGSGESRPGREGPFPDVHETDHRLLVALSKIGIALKTQAWKETGPRGLNPTQAQVLAALLAEGARGLRLGALALRLGVSAPTVSDSVSSLAEKGLVERKPAPDDARARCITLTAVGEEAAGELSEWPDSLLRATHVLSTVEQGVFLRALLKMIRELQVSGQVAPARMCVTCEFFRANVHEDPLTPHHCAFVDAPFGDRSLRVDCGEHAEAEEGQQQGMWARFLGGGALP